MAFRSHLEYNSSLVQSSPRLSKSDKVDVAMKKLQPLTKNDRKKITNYSGDLKTGHPDTGNILVQTFTIQVFI